MAVVVLGEQDRALIAGQVPLDHAVDVELLRQESGQFASRPAARWAPRLMFSPSHHASLWTLRATESPS